MVPAGVGWGVEAVLLITNDFDTGNTIDGRLSRVVSYDGGGGGARLDKWVIFW